MPKTAPKQFNEAFCTRTRELREATGMSQIEMAGALGVSAEAYRKYEKRSPLPHYLVIRFCAITKEPLADLFKYAQNARIPRKTAA